VILADDKIQTIDSNLTEPLRRGLSALLVGRSFSSKQGIFILPRLIDADYTGTIKIMIKAFFPPIHIMAGTRVAQLIPFKGMVPHTSKSFRGDKGFGSSDDPKVFFTIPVTNQKPTRTVTFDGPHNIASTLVTLLDTGADVSIFPKRQWPASWPLNRVYTQVMGIRGVQDTQVSTGYITVTDVEDTQLRAQIKPYVVDSPILLLG